MMTPRNLAQQSKQAPIPRASQYPTPSRPTSTAKILKETLAPKAATQQHRKRP